jgi:hypothetical protein
MIDWKEGESETEVFSKGIARAPPYDRARAGRRSPAWRAARASTSRREGGAMLVHALDEERETAVPGHHKALQAPFSWEALDEERETAVPGHHKALQAPFSWDAV